MSLKSSVEKREKSMAELLIVVVVFSVLMAIFISYFMPQKARMSHTGFNRLANNFISQLTTVHGQWLMDNKPAVVILSSMSEGKKEHVPVNKLGWIDVNEPAIACQMIWQLALDIPMDFMQSPVSAIEVKNTSQKMGRICRYSVSSITFFEYYTATGKVIINNMLNEDS